MRKRIVITGGHHNSALVVAEKLREKGYEVIWFGHKFTMWGDKNVGAEYREVTQAGFKFIEIKAGKFYRTYHPLKILRLPLGFMQSFYYLLKFRPRLILSFGGYLAVPVVISGWFLRIPSMTHEQTVVYGLANRLIGHFAKKIFVSWEASLKHFPAHKVVFTGLPLRPEIFSHKKSIFDFKNDLPTIYITGGKQGSHAINQAVEEALPNLLKEFNLILACGRSTVFDDLNDLTRIKRKLMRELRQRYLLQDYFTRQEVGSVLAVADLVVGRAGAHIVYEIAALSKPAIFIPIPWSYQDEQFKNAQLLVEAGIAEILPQNQLNGKNLYRLVKSMTENLEKYQKAASKARSLIKLKATENMVKEINDFLR